MRGSRCALFCIVLCIGACGVEITDPIAEEHRVRAEETFDAATLEASLAEILSWHEVNETDVPAVLQPGHQRSVLRARFADVGCLPPEELMLLWEWRNGAGPTPHPFLWYHNFLSMEQALAERASLIANPLVAWPAEWIPVFEFEGEWYFVECRPQPRTSSPVGCFFLEDPEPIYAYVSLTRMLETAAAWFQEDAITWNREQQGMVENLAKLSEIHRGLNEGATFPYYIE